MALKFPEEQRRRLERAVSKSVQVEDEKGEFIGAGVIIKSNGTIITAQHVVGSSKTMIVRRLCLKRKGWDIFSRYSYVCDIVYVDKALDIAVLKMRCPPKDLSVAKLCDSDELGSDTPVWRVGRDDEPLADGWVVRISHDKGVPEYKIAMRALPGSSGGPVFDRQGCVVGIALKVHDQKQEPQASYALPINVIKNLVLSREEVKAVIGEIS